MIQRHRDRMDECCERMVPRMRESMRALWPKLLDNKIFNRDDVNVPRWTKCLDEEETTRDIYLTIKTRGPQAFELFLTSLRQCGLENLALTLEGNRRETEPPRPQNGTRIHSENQIAKQPETQSTKRDLDGFFQYIQRSEKPLEIEVQKATEFLDEPTLVKDIERYPMRSKPRGLVLIITIVDYIHSVEPPRYSATHDEENLRLLFEGMGFQVETYRNLTGQGIMDKVLEFSKREELRKVDSCFVIISSHGNSSGTETGLDPRMEDAEIQGIDYLPSGFTEDYRKVTCASVIDCFTVKACPNLAGKPKIFIFQLCRGEKKQKSAVEARHAIDSSTYIVPESPSAMSHVPGKTSLRNYSDMLVAHSTMPGYVAFRDSKTGSWFIQILCEVFMNYACEKHVQDLFNMVDDRLAIQRTLQEGCQTPTITSLGFNKHCYINPGLFE